MSLIERKCESCGFSVKGAETCPLTQLPVNENSSCSFYEREPNSCDLCHTKIPKSATVYNKNMLLCPHCAKQLTTCAGCNHSNYCAFEQDPSPLPKIVEKRIQQGNMIQIMQVRNPDRIRETCAKGCKCFRENFPCMRQINCCDSWEGIH